MNAETPSASPPGPTAKKRPQRRFGFPKRRRLLKRRDYLRVQDRSARVTTSHFILLIAPRPSEGPVRLGVVASKKVGGATARNRAKRLVREAFRNHPALFPPGIDLVVIAKPGAHELTFDIVCREIEAVSGVIARRCREVTRK